MVEVGSGEGRRRKVECVVVGKEVERREVNQQNMSLLVNKAVTFVEEMQRQIDSDSSADDTIQQPKTLINCKSVPLSPLS